MQGKSVNAATAVLQGHGDADPLVTLPMGQLTSSILSAFNPNHAFKTYPGMGHSSCDQVPCPVHSPHEASMEPQAPAYRKSRISRHLWTSSCPRNEARCVLHNGIQSKLRSVTAENCASITSLSTFAHLGVVSKFSIGLRFLRGHEFAWLDSREKLLPRFSGE